MAGRDHPWTEAMPKVKGDTGNNKLTPAKGKMYWKVQPEDKVITFPKLSKDVTFKNLAWNISVYDSTFDPAIKAKSRDRIPIQALFTSWGNDFARSSDEAKGAFKHSWPLQTLHEGGVGNAADQTFDLPVFFADVEWSEQQNLEFAEHTPLQRLRDANAFNQMLWTSPSTPTLRIRMIRPAQARCDGAVLEFNFPIADADLTGDAAGNKTVVLLCIGQAILWTCVDELLQCTYWPPSSNDRKSVLKWIDSFGNESKQTDGPVLITRSLQGKELRIVWLFRPNHDSCQGWARERLIGDVGQPNLGKLVMSRLRAELEKGGAGLAVGWGTHFDSIASGY